MMAKHKRSHFARDLSCVLVVNVICTLSTIIQKTMDRRLLYYSGMRLSYRMIWALPTTYVNLVFTTTFYHEKRTCYKRLLQSYCVDLRCLSLLKKRERKRRSCFEVGILFLAPARKQDLTVVLLKRNTLLPGRASL